MTLQFDQSDNTITKSIPVGISRYDEHVPSYANGFKRLLDLALILVAAPIIIPVIAIIAVCIALDGSNPFYTSKRVGKFGRSFGMLKLRTMVANADEKLEEFLQSDPAARQEWNETQKLKNDPRVTRLGRILRKCSIDELPQLWNVLTGDMSLVGPRPMLPEQRAIYPGTAYYALRPGVTGPWQVSARNESTFADRAVFDEEYEKNLSFGTDVSLIAKTFGVMLKGTGY